MQTRNEEYTIGYYNDDLSSVLTPLPKPPKAYAEDSFWNLLRLCAVHARLVGIHESSTVGNVVCCHRCVGALVTTSLLRRGEFCCEFSHTSSIPKRRRGSAPHSCCARRQSCSKQSTEKVEREPRGRKDRNKATNCCTNQSDGSTNSAHGSNHCSIRQVFTS